MMLSRSRWFVVCGWMLCAVLPVSALAQSDATPAPNAQPEPSPVIDSDKNERDRIASERALANQVYEAERRACYQKFAVSACLNEARDRHNEKLSEFKRQEITLNDAQRRRAAANRIGIIENRSSAQSMQEREDRRNEARQASHKREAARAQRQKELDEKRQAQPKGQAQQLKSATASAQQRADEVARAAQRRAQAAEREARMNERQQKLKEREAQRTKPPAAGLPIPK